MARIILNTFGSFGDLHPYLAVAIGLRERGHDAVVATSEVYRAKVEAEGVGFLAVRPDVGQLLDQQKFVEKLWHPRLGTEYLIREYLIPALEGSYEDLLDGCRGADLILTHLAAFAGPIVAERLRIPWAAVVLQPMAFLSKYDPPVIAPAPWLRHWYGLGTFEAARRLAVLRMAKWAEPIEALRQRVGLPMSTKNPMLGGQFSELATLALFSRSLAQPQHDWPSHTYQTGFVFYDQPGVGMPGAQKVDEGLWSFLENGPAPVLFTLGSSAVMHPGQFYHESIRAAEELGVRAVLLVGWQAADSWKNLPRSIYAAGYVPFSEIMPRCAATVHQGGIGTTAQALRAGRPTIVVPWAHDQPDNAERLRKLGVSRTLGRGQYRARRVARELRDILGEPTYCDKAKAVADQISREDGTARACDVIESLIESCAPGGEPYGLQRDFRQRPH